MTSTVLDKLPGFDPNDPIFAKMAGAPGDPGSGMAINPATGKMEQVYATYGPSDNGMIGGETRRFFASDPNRPASAQSLAGYAPGYYSNSGFGTVDELLSRAIPIAGIAALSAGAAGMLAAPSATAADTVAPAAVSAGSAGTAEAAPIFGDAAKIGGAAATGAATSGGAMSALGLANAGEPLTATQGATLQSAFDTGAFSSAPAAATPSGSGASSGSSALKTAGTIATIVSPIASIAASAAGIDASKKMGQLTGQPVVAPPVTIPTSGSADTLNAMRANIQEQVTRRGRAATILTSPSGGTLGG